MQLRTIAPYETDALLDAIAGFYAEADYGWTREPLARAVTRLLNCPELGRAWWLEHDGEHVGYAVVTYGFALEARGREGLLDEFYIVPQWRGRGLGAAAMALIESACRQAGVRNLILEAEADNTAALALYRRRGFTASKRVQMEKRL